MPYAILKPSFQPPGLRLPPAVASTPALKTLVESSICEYQAGTTEEKSQEVDNPQDFLPDIDWHDGDGFLCEEKDSCKIHFPNGAEALIETQEYNNDYGFTGSYIKIFFRAAGNGKPNTKLIHFEAGEAVAEEPVEVSKSAFDEVKMDLGLGEEIPISLVVAVFLSRALSRKMLHERFSYLEPDGGKIDFYHQETVPVFTEALHALFGLDDIGQISQTCKKRKIDQDEKKKKKKAPSKGQEVITIDD